MRPVHLFYASCHWLHTPARGSFSMRSISPVVMVVVSCSDWHGLRQLLSSLDEVRLGPDCPAWKVDAVLVTHHLLRDFLRRSLYRPRLIILPRLKSTRNAVDLSTHIGRG